MKKRTRYQAAVPAWVLIAAMGMSPVFSAVGIAGNGVVYGSELDSGTSGVYAGENVGQDEMLAGSLPGYSSRGEEGEWEKESGKSPEVDFSARRPQDGQAVLSWLFCHLEEEKMVVSE